MPNIHQKEGSRTDGSSAATTHDKYSKMKVLELRRMLRQKGLPMSGSAEEMRRILAAEDARSEANSAVTYSTDKYDGLKILALRKELKKRGLDTLGSEKELKQRLAKFDARSDPQEVLTIDNCSKYCC